MFQEEEAAVVVLLHAVHTTRAVDLDRDREHRSYCTAVAELAGHILVVPILDPVVHWMEVVAEEELRSWTWSEWQCKKKTRGSKDDFVWLRVSTNGLWWGSSTLYAVQYFPNFDMSCFYAIHTVEEDSRGKWSFFVQHDTQSDTAQKRERDEIEKRRAQLLCLAPAADRQATRERRRRGTTGARVREYGAQFHPFFLLGTAKTPLGLYSNSNSNSNNNNNNNNNVDNDNKSSKEGRNRHEASWHKRLRMLL